jgi:hypothetical protein
METTPENELTGEPEATMPAPTTEKKPTRVDGKDLVPDISKISLRAGTSHRYTFWCGLMDNCPVNQIDVAGISFVKTTDKVINDLASGTTRRIPQPGGLFRIDGHQYKKLIDRLKYIVIRFDNQPEIQNVPGEGENTGDPARRAKKAHLITIPREKDIKAKEEAGLPVHRYHPSPNDEAAAKYMYAQYCPNGQRTGEVIGSLADVGIDQFPGDMPSKPKRRGRPPKKDKAKK